jgi:C4-dicarboxylate-specific signal transduction histidine kinase
VDDTLSTLGYQPGFRDLELQLELEPDLPAVAVPPGKLHQVLVNLLLNASDAMEGRGRVLITAHSQQQLVQLRVRDTGPGIPPQVMEQLFEPFFTTKPPGSGVGLGLATSQSIARGLGGELWAENHPDGGAVFVLDLPLATLGVSAAPRTDGGS